MASRKQGQRRTANSSAILADHLTITAEVYQREARAALDRKAGLTRPTRQTGPLP